MGSAVSAISDFAGSALGIGRGGNVSGQGYIDDLNALAAENARAQMDASKALKDQQTAFGQSLADRAAGKAPSLAEAQMKMTQDRNLAQQLAATKANRAVNPALAFRQNQQMGAQTNQQVAQASTAAKLQEDAQNQMMFGNYLNQQQQNTNQALGTGQKSAESLFAAQTGKRNADMNMVNQIGGAGMSIALSDKNQKTNVKSASSENAPEAKSNYASGGLIPLGGAQYKPIPGQMYEDILKGGGGQPDLNSKGGFADMLKQLMSQGAPMQGGLEEMGGANAGNIDMGTAATGGAMMMAEGGRVPGPEVVPGDSEQNDIVDIKASAGEMVVPKTVVQKGPEAVSKFAKQEEEKQFNPKSFLDALKAQSYEYKNPNQPGAAPGRHMGVMAQDLEKAGPVGKSMVMNTPNGKVVNYGQGFGAILAAQADLNERLRQIEDTFGPKKPKKDK